MIMRYNYDYRQQGLCGLSTQLVVSIYDAVVRVPFHLHKKRKKVYERPITESPPSHVPTVHPSLSNVLLIIGPRTGTPPDECSPRPVITCRGRVGTTQPSQSTSRTIVSASEEVQECTSIVSDAELAVLSNNTVCQLIVSHCKTKL